MRTAYLPRQSELLQSVLLIPALFFTSSLLVHNCLQYLVGHTKHIDRKIFQLLFRIVGRVQAFHFLPYFTLIKGQVRDVFTADFCLYILKNIAHFTTPIWNLGKKKAVSYYELLPHYFGYFCKILFIFCSLCIFYIGIYFGIIANIHFS